MGSSKKNLLEAFRNAGDVPLPQDELREDRLQPLTPEEERLLDGETRLQSDLTSGGKHSWRSDLPAMPAWLLYVAGAGVLFVLALGIKNLGQDDDVEAAVGDTAAATEAAGPRAGEPAGIVPAQVPTSEQVRQPVVVPPPTGPAGASPDQAAAETTSPLLDRTNAWTVVVITYSRSATSAEDLAWATFDHLQAEGIPVFTPVEIGNKIVVLAGAAPRSSDLSGLEKRIAGLARGGRPNIYTGAYAERIEKFIDRD